MFIEWWYCLRGLGMVTNGINPSFPYPFPTYMWVFTLEHNGLTNGLTNKRTDWAKEVGIEMMKYSWPKKTQSVPIPHSSIWSYLNIFRQTKTFSIRAYFDISKYDLQKFDFLCCVFCKIWLNSIAVCLVYGLQWFSTDFAT